MLNALLDYVDPRLLWLNSLYLMWIAFLRSQRPSLLPPLRRFVLALRSRGLEPSHPYKHCASSMCGCQFRLGREFKTHCAN